MRLPPLPPESGRLGAAIGGIILGCLIAAPVVTLLLLLIFAGVLARFYFLSSFRTDNLPPTASSLPASTPREELLPSSSGAVLGTRAHILRADTEMIQSDTEKKHAQTQQSQVTRGLIRERLELAAELNKIASIPALLGNDASGSPPSSLSLNELQGLLAAMPEVPPALAKAIIKVFGAALADKVAR